MKKITIIFSALIIMISVTACTGKNKLALTSETQAEASRTAHTAAESETQSSAAETASKTAPETTKEETEMKMNIRIGDNTLTATLAENSSAEALLEMLSEGGITINMSDYANMEKVGTLPESLPRNDERINTEAGDLILYLGNSFVIYYDENSWELTRLGKIDNITQKELKDILGSGDVTAVLSLPTE